MSASLVNATKAAFMQSSHDNIYDAIVDHQSNTGGFIVAAITVTFTAVLELLSLPYVKKVLNQPGGQRLYLTALFYNLLNNMVLGPLIWYVAVDLLCRPPLPAFECAWKTVGLLGVHSLRYYMGHAAMHRPELYWAHKLHHKFHCNVTPVAANCVTITEYLIAYMLPFVVGIFFFRPDRLALLRAVSLISMNNILIHTPALSEPASKFLPWLFVGTHDHLEHHARLTTKYAAPTISIDRIVEMVCDALGVEKVYWPGPVPKHPPPKKAL